MTSQICFSVSDVGAAEALFVAAHECTSDSHLSSSFIRVALLSLLGSLGDSVLAGTFADSEQEAVGGAAVAVPVLWQQWSLSSQSLLLPAGLRGSWEFRYGFTDQREGSFKMSWMTLGSIDCSGKLNLSVEAHSELGLGISAPCLVIGRNGFESRTISPF